MTEELESIESLNARGLCQCCKGFWVMTNEAGLCGRCEDNRTRTKRSYVTSPGCPNCPDRDFATQQVSGHRRAERSE